MSMDSPDLAIAKRLLDHLKLRGFQFQRTALGVDAPLIGHRVSDEWADTVLIEGFSSGCYAWRQRASILILPGEGLIERQVQGSALTVLNEVLTWKMGTLRIPKEEAHHALHGPHRQRC
ncbi:MAG: hypothetical protein ACRDTG_30620 [Pseudonocardiaceae bacterium]